MFSAICPLENLMSTGPNEVPDDQISGTPGAPENPQEPATKPKDIKPGGKPFVTPVPTASKPTKPFVIIKPK